MTSNYVSEGITFKPGSALSSIFRAELLGLSPQSNISPACIKLRLCKIDDCLSKDKWTYVGRTQNTGLDRSEFKISNIIKAINQTQSEFMPFVMLRQNDPRDLVVENGRHRIAYFFENGFEYIWCVIPAAQEALFKEHYT